MQRRQFVATALLAGSLPGCSAPQATDAPSESNDTSQSPEDDTTDTMTQENETSATRQIKLTNVELPTEDIPIRFGIDILEDEVTPTHPAKIEVGFVFTDEAHIKTEFEPPMGLTQSADDTPGLVLLPPDLASNISRVNDEMWKPDRAKDEKWLVDTTAYENTESPHSLLANELELWADHQYDGYFEPGEYRFDHGFAFDNERVSWSFTISVTDSE